MKSEYIALRVTYDENEWEDAGDAAFDRKWLKTGEEVTEVSLSDAYWGSKYPEASAEELKFFPLPVRDTEDLTFGNPPCEYCGDCTIRINQLGWGERCASCDAHGSDLEDEG